jgi:hypothetical protein
MFNKLAHRDTAEAVTDKNDWRLGPLDCLGHHSFVRLEVTPNRPTAPREIDRVYCVTRVGQGAYNIPPAPRTVKPTVHQYIRRHYRTQMVNTTAAARGNARRQN